MPKLSSVVTHALLAYAATTADGFTPSSLMAASPSSNSATSSSSSSATTSTALHVSVVSSFLTKEEAENKITNIFETETPESVGIQQVTKNNNNNKKKAVPQTASSNSKNKRSNRRNRRKHNYSANKAFRNEQPDTDFYTLHSSAVSHLHKDMPIQDITRAIKRAQNLHDVHDLGTIAAFLLDECDTHWGYGFRGSLLSRTAVAALHMDDLSLAKRAIQARNSQERPSMQPYESAAIVRGLMRVGQVDEAWKVLEDELPLPMATSMSDKDQELIQHRARVLASMVSRHFYNGEPHLASRSLEALAVLGDLLFDKKILMDDLHLPWTRLVNAAMDCRFNPEECSVDLPTDLSEMVFDAMGAFPCPGGEEECGLDDYLFDE